MSIVKKDNSEKKIMKKDTSEQEALYTLNFEKEKSEKGKSEQGKLQQIVFFV